MTSRGRWTLVRDLLAAEGPASVARRLLDRWSAARRERDFARLQPGAIPPRLRTPILHVSAHPPDPWRGGVETQLLARLEAEARCWPVALLHPRSGGHRLELFGPSGRCALDRDAREPHRPDHLAGDPALEAALLWAVDLLGSRLVVVEGLAGQSAASLERCIEARRLDLLLSLHDYAFACPWPALVAADTGEACDLCREATACAARTGRATIEIADRRQTAGHLIRRARLVVVPSLSLASGLARLVPGAGIEVVPPTLQLAPLAGRPRPSARRRVAFLGGGQAHKGALLFERLVAAWPGPPVEWHVYGGGDRSTLRRLARLPGVAIRGYYRAGTLARRLRAEGMDLALLLSPWPESYLMTLDECLAGGTPVVLFDHGAPAERVSPDVGVLVPSAGGAEAVQEVLLRWLAGGPPAAFVPRPVPRPEEAARAFRAIYERLGFAPGTSDDPASSAATRSASSAT